MMKKGLLIALGAGALFLAGGCATALPQGGVFTKVNLPVSMADASVKPVKTGVSEAKSYVGIVAIGDASIKAAMKNGGIKKVHHVDYDAFNVLGLFGKYTTTVYGE